MTCKYTEAMSYIRANVFELNTVHLSSSHLALSHSTHLNARNMGQYWKFLNVDKYSEVDNGHGKKLYELLSNRELECLVHYLRVPPNLALVIVDHAAIVAMKMTK